MSNMNVGWLRLFFAFALYTCAVLTPVGSYASWGFFLAYLFIAYKALSALWAEANLPSLNY